MLSRDTELKGLDHDAANSMALSPLNGFVKTYGELDRLLGIRQGEQPCVKRFNTSSPTIRSGNSILVTADDGTTGHLADQKNINHSPAQIETLQNHLKRLSASFGKKDIHDIESSEVSDPGGSSRV